MSPDSSRGRRPLPPYRRSAEVYDTVYSWKDYAAESRRIHQLIRRYGPSPARTLLDVACGTGAHLRYLSKWYRVTGLDRSPEMIRRARRNLPRARFVRGTMQGFRLPQRFDAITCLFSAIGYVRSDRELRRTIRNFARHLRPGGVLIVEPWLTPSQYAVGSIHLGTFGTRDAPIARMNSSERRGHRSIMDMHYLVPDGSRVRHWVERHELSLFDVPSQLAAYRAAGLRVRHMASRFKNERGLYVAVKPAEDGESPGLRGPRRLSR